MCRFRWSSAKLRAPGILWLPLCVLNNPYPSVNRGTSCICGNFLCVDADVSDERFSWMIRYGHRQWIYGQQGNASPEGSVKLCGPSAAGNRPEFAVHMLRILPSPRKVVISDIAHAAARPAITPCMNAISRRADHSSNRVAPA